jgi:hypothetical protein
MLAIKQELYIVHESKKAASKLNMPIDLALLDKSRVACCE